MKPVRTLATVLLLAGAAAHAVETRLGMVHSGSFTVFHVAEWDLTFAGDLAAATILPDDQINDAYDADRDGRWLRVIAEFRHESGLTLAVPAFAMRDAPGGVWRWRVRWSPLRAGVWHARLALEGCLRVGAPPLAAATDLDQPIQVADEPAADGFLIMPDAANRQCLRELRADGSARPCWQFGADRAWVVESDAKGRAWEPFEGIDRSRDLFPVLRANGYNLLGQWLAPWEYQLVHRDRAEWWRDKLGHWTRHALDETAAWTPWACYDQGRAQAFDALVRQCEGAAGEATIRMLLAPLPHKCVQMRSRHWPDAASNWSVEDDGSKQSPAKICGFSAFNRPPMSAWDFFAADPSAPHDEWRARLFDAQRDFWRYVIARWGASRAIGIWVLMDEIDAVGDEIGILPEGSGWFAHPECQRWLTETAAFVTAIDAYHHPLHAATTSIGTEFRPGGNLEWRCAHAGDPPSPMVIGWHWYPRWPSGSTYNDAWSYAIDGIAAFSAQPDAHPRLIGEFGGADRLLPEDEPVLLYPSLYHFACWAAIFSGQAGTVMDWDDGKEFGELRWRDQPGIFDRDHYPVDNAAQVKALRGVLDGIDAQALSVCTAATAIAIHAGEGVRAFALTTRIAGAAQVHGWAFAASGRGRVMVTGLPPGRYRLSWHDPWSGEALAAVARDLTSADGALLIDLAPALALMRPTDVFPRTTRLDRGKDVAFHLVPVAP